MKRHIFRAILAVALAVLLTSLVLIMGVLYGYFQDRITAELARSTAYIAHGLETQGMDYLTGRRTAAEPEVLRCGTLAVDPGGHTVTVAGRAVALTQKEFEVLCLLLNNRGQVLSRERLISEVWGYAFTGESRTVDVHVRTLRQKLGEAGAYIETVRGYGYKISQESRDTV